MDDRRVQAAAEEVHPHRAAAGTRLAVSDLAVGPLAGGGKSSLLRTIHRLNDLTDVVALSGRIWMDGELVEFAEGKRLFTRPQNQRTEDYVEGRFG